MKLDKSLKWVIVLVFAVTILAVFFGILHAASVLPAQPDGKTVSNRELEDWTEEDSTADGDHVFSLSMPAEELSGHALLVWNNGQPLRLSLNGEELCVLAPEKFSETLRVSGMSLINLPEFSGEGRLTLTITPLEGDSVTLPQIVLGTSLGLIKFLITKDMATVILLILLVILTLIVVLSGIFYRAFVSRGIRLAALLLFLIDGFLWVITDTGLYMFLGLRMEMAGIICYYAFMFLPVPIILQCWSISNKKGHSAKVVLVLIALNLVVQTILSATGIISLLSMIMATHLLMFLSLADSLYILGRSLADTENTYLKIYFIDMIVLTVFAVLAIILYWFFGSTVYRVLTLSGMLIFHLVVEWIVILEHRDELRAQAKQEAQSRILETFSYKDVMTNLPNRRAFEDYLSKISDNPFDYAHALLLMIDLNGLKSVNDGFGHQAGDALICSAADCLRQVFEGCGLISRIGGDEFTVIINQADHSPAWYGDALRAEADRMNAKQEYKLSFAVGSSYFYGTQGLPKSVSDWKQEADNDMYANKSKMKEEAGIADRQGLQDIIQGIVQTSDARDGYMAEHSVRVAALAVFLAEKADLPEDEVLMIERAALLHNLGNIAIPDYILKKPGKLTPEEMNTIKQHSIIGSSIVEKAAGLERVARIILQHHERFDGLGYPDGIKGAEIDIGARIIALCDSIESMTSPRSYRPEINWDDCRTEIIKNMGKRYDTDLCRLVLENWDEVIDIKMRKTQLL